MAYVSARYAGTSLLPREGTAPQIVAVDENGIEFYFMEDSQVGDWLRYLAKGGTIDPAPVVLKTEEPQ